MALTYNHTMRACYLASISHAIINGFTPLLFVVFMKEFGLDFSQVGALISINFGIQMVVDLLCAKYIERIDHRKIIVASLLFASAGLVFLSILPKVFSNPFLGLIIAVIVYGIGGGVIEVMNSPTMESLPSESKATAMSLMHSFYCWGHLAVIIFTTLFFVTVGITNWRILPFLWALVPLYTAILFAKVPLNRFGEGHEIVAAHKLFNHRTFIVLMLMMIFVGASEQAIGQWASAFAELGLNVSKSTGDLLGPGLFTTLMGLSRLAFGKYGKKLNLVNYIFVCAIVCMIGYGVVIFSGNAIISLLGCGIAGLAVGIMWPGVLSLSAKKFPIGGTAMFALLALAGDIGCSIGPGLVGVVSNNVSSTAENSLKYGFTAAIIFPLGLAVSIIVLTKFTNAKSESLSH